VSPARKRTRSGVTRWSEAGEAHRIAFGELRPAATMVEVSKLIDPRLLIEIEAVAHREEGVGDAER
jgi:enamine deaminase RidA (YjgF/YER057c/UK114 family)